MRVWQDIVSDPALGLPPIDTQVATAEVIFGHAIEMKRPDLNGCRIVFPYSLFWRVIDVIHEERKQLRG